MGRDIVQQKFWIQVAWSSKWPQGTFGVFGLHRRDAAVAPAPTLRLGVWEWGINYWKLREHGYEPWKFHEVSTCSDPKTLIPDTTSFMTPLARELLDPLAWFKTSPVVPCAGDPQNDSCRSTRTGFYVGNVLKFCVEPHSENYWTLGNLELMIDLFPLFEINKF